MNFTDWKTVLSGRGVKRRKTEAVGNKHLARAKAIMSAYY